MYFYIFKSLFWLSLPNKHFFLKLNTQLSTNIFKHNHQIFYKNNFFEKLFKNKLNKLTLLCVNLFSANKNIIFIDYNYNYNYLPITHKNLIKSSSKNIFKLAKYFNVSSIIFFNLNFKKSFFKKYFNLNLINISTGTNQKNFDINLNVVNLPILHYIIYIYISQIYLKINNNNLNINGS